MIQNRSKVLQGLLFTLYNLRIKNVQELLPGGVCRLTDQAGFFVSKALTSSRVSFEYFAAAMASVSDGAIVGSAIIKLIAKHGKQAAPIVGEYVRKMKEALK